MRLLSKEVDTKLISAALNLLARIAADPREEGVWWVRSLTIYTKAIYGGFVNQFLVQNFILHT